MYQCDPLEVCVSLQTGNRFSYQPNLLIPGLDVTIRDNTALRSKFVKDT